MAKKPMPLCCRSRRLSRWLQFSIPTPRFRHRLTAYRGLLPGYFVRIRIPVGTTKDALFVPDEAMGSKRGSRTLLLVNTQNVVEQALSAWAPSRAIGG